MTDHEYVYRADVVLLTPTERIERGDDIALRFQSAPSAEQVTAKLADAYRWVEDDVLEIEHLSWHRIA